MKLLTAHVWRVNRSIPVLVGKTPNDGDFLYFVRFDFRTKKDHGTERVRTRFCALVEPFDRSIHAEGFHVRRSENGGAGDLGPDSAGSRTPVSGECPGGVAGHSFVTFWLWTYLAWF